ncbi:unnamed protein product [Prunus armeniaca]
MNSLAGLTLLKLRIGLPTLREGLKWLCPDGDQVPLVAFLLKGNAYHWWKTVPRGYADPIAVTRAEFQRVYKQFYLHSYWNAKKSKFLHLKQGSMSVFEYEHKFNELSRFAPELIPTEEEKCRRFEKGLRLDIQAVITATTYPTMKALAQTADRVSKKLSVGDARRPMDTSGFGGPSQGPSKRGGSNSSSAVGDLGLGQLGVSILGSSRWPVGQFRRDCPQLGQTGGPSQRGSAGRRLGPSIGRAVEVRVRARVVLHHQRQALHPVMECSLLSMVGVVGAKGEAHATPDVIIGMIPVFGLRQPEVTFREEHRVLPSCLISTITARRLLKRGCVGYLAHIIDTREVTLNLKDVLVVREFSDVFPDDLHGLPP